MKNQSGTISASRIFLTPDDERRDTTLVIENGIIADIRLATKSETIDDIVILPGLINTHTHLEHSAAGILLEQNFAHKKFDSFSKWAETLAEVSESLSLEEKKKGVFEAYQRLDLGGSSVILDHRHPHVDWVGEAVGITTIINWEILGAAKDRAISSLEESKRKRSPEDWTSPHSYYAVHPDVLNGDWPSRRQAIHFLESAEEDDCFRKKSGPLQDLVRQRGGESPLSLNTINLILEKIKSLDQLLLVHANYITEEEIEVLTPYHEKITFVYCPDSHDFFRHKSFPLQKILQHGFKVTLGTDSLASNFSLSLWEAVKKTHQQYPEIELEAVLKMATIDGADALGLKGEKGFLEIGKPADMFVVRSENFLPTIRP